MRALLALTLVAIVTGGCARTAAAPVDPMEQDLSDFFPNRQVSDGATPCSPDVVRDHDRFSVWAASKAGEATIKITVAQPGASGLKSDASFLVTVAPVVNLFGNGAAAA